MTPFFYITPAVAVAAFVVGCTVGYNNRDNMAKAAAAKAFQAAEKQRYELQEKVNVISAKYEAERSRASQIHLERTNTIRRYYSTSGPVAASCVVPDAIYRLLTNSVRDANASTSGEPVGEMPTNFATPKPLG
jgi:tRNA G37 N-methylase TrmD